MTTVIKLVIATVLSLLMSSCNFGFGVKGNGNVKTTERTVTGSFEAIEVGNGLDLYLTQSDNERISVQADENLHDLIKTDIEGGVLKIYTSDNINFSQAQKIMVSFKDLSRISASSGSDVYATNTVQTKDLKLETGSGSDMTLDIKVQSVLCKSSSGSDLELSGTAVNFTADASSGSDIDAAGLTAETSRLEATSGSDITTHTTGALFANASSGGTIKYSGNPSKVEKSDNVSGTISPQ